MVALNFRILYALLASLTLLHVVVARDLVTDLVRRGRPAMNAAIANSTTCTKEKLRIRREWYGLFLIFFSCFGILTLGTQGRH